MAKTSASTMPEPVIPPVIDDPPTETPPTVPVPEPDPTHSPVVPPRPEPEPGTYEALYEEARRRGLKGRSTMSKRELARALGR